MKILILGSKEYPMGTSDDPIKSGGMESYTPKLVDHLRDKVEKVIIITRKFANTVDFEEHGNIEIHRVPWTKGFFVRNITFNINSFFKGLNVDGDIILAFGAFASFFGVFLSRLKGKKLVAVPHGIAYGQPQYNPLIKQVLNLVESTAYGKADAVVFLSEAEKDQFEKKMGFIPNKYEIIPTGVEVPDVSGEEVKDIKEEFGLGGSTVITAVARLIGVKGLDVLIKAAGGLEGDFKLLMVGDGPEREKLETLAQKEGIANKVIFAGWREDIPQVLAASDIFVLSSYSEGLPMSLLEAMASGKVCIVTEIGLPVEDGKDALVVPPGDEKALGMAIQRVLDDEKLRGTLGQEAKKKTAAEFSWEGTVVGYLALFKGIS